MNPPARKPTLPPSRRRYLVHLSCVSEPESQASHYIARIRPWAARSAPHCETCQRIFADECELIATINPLLPPGSDVRDVFDHVESASGFFYLLQLSGEEAGQLGWRRETNPGHRA